MSMTSPCPSKRLNLNGGFRGHLAVVIPSYRVKNHILGVIGTIGSAVSRIYVVDDACPENSGAYVSSHCTDKRVRVLRNSINLGVGGAVMVGYRAALDDGAEIIIKLDGDGQMDGALIPHIIAPIVSGSADYTKGNRFFSLDRIRSMPTIRLLGNAALSFITKFSSGYWSSFDPTNGYTAIHAYVARRLPFDKISKRYFFETDMLFRLNTLRAVVVDVPMDAYYGSEVSNLKISQVLFEFSRKHIRNTFKRIFYNYYLRDLSIASVELPLGLVALCFGIIFGAMQWVNSLQTGEASSAGTVMLAGLPILAGLQLILAFLAYDIASVPSRPLHLDAGFDDSAVAKSTGDTLPSLVDDRDICP